MDHFWTFRCAFAWQAQGIVDSKVSKTWGFCSISKNDGRRGTFEEDLQRCIFRGRRSARDMLFIRDVRRSGRWFPESGCILEHQIFRFAEMILRDRCSTSYDNIKNASIQRDFLNFCTWQHQKLNGSARLPEFLNLTTSKTKQFGETSFKNGKLSAELTASYLCVLWFFDSTCLSYCACHEKVIPGRSLAE